MSEFKINISEEEKEVLSRKIVVSSSIEIERPQKRKTISSVEFYNGLEFLELLETIINISFFEEEG